MRRFCAFLKSVLCRNSVTQVKPFFRGFFHIATCHATILIIKQRDVSYGISVRGILRLGTQN